MSHDYEDTTQILHEIVLGEYTYMTSEEKTARYLLNSFDDAIIHLDDKKIPYLNLTDSIDNHRSKADLNYWHLQDRVYVPDLAKIDSDQRREAVIEARNRQVRDIITRTYEIGYQTPAPIQKICIPQIISGADCVIQSKSGTGKTHSFTFGTLYHFDIKNPNLQHVYVTSSHEVARQIHQHVCSLLSKDAKVTLCIGNGIGNQTHDSHLTIGTSSLISQPSGGSNRDEISQSQIIVCTMGKFYDTLIKRKWIKLDYLKTFCVDEFDKIIASKNYPSTSMSTEEQMDRVMANIDDIDKRDRHDTNEKYQIQRLFFSATVTRKSLDKARSYFRPYSDNIGPDFMILVKTEDTTLDGIRQYYVNCISHSEKKDILLDLLSLCRIAQCIVFTNKIDAAIDIKRFLDNKQIPITCEFFHGEMSASDRKQIHSDFVSGKIRLLVATDVMSRGLDLQSINLVINLDMPPNLETYIHRIGRSGRYGRKGVAISMIMETDRDQSLFKQINSISKSNKLEHLPADLENLL
jgi:ATP-dependent RNA helicase